MAYKGFPYHIPLINGRNNNANQAQKSPSDLETAFNITLHDGSIQKDFGEVNVNSSTLTDPIRVGNDYYPTPASQRTVIFVGGAVKKSSGTGSGAFSNLVTGLTEDSIGQFVLAGREFTNSDPKLFFFNGVDFPQYLSADGSSMERIGFRASLTDAFDTTSGSAVLTVNHTSHGLSTGDRVSLVGFTNPLNGQNPNVSNAAVTVTGANAFTVTVAGNFNANSTGVGGTGKYYAHPNDWTGSTQPEGGVYNNSRLIVFLGQNIYGSDPENHIDFEVDSEVDSAVAYSGVGAKIQALANFQTRLVIFKNPVGIIQVSDVFGAAQQSFVLPIQLGLAGKNAFCTTNDGDLLFISNLGSIHSMAAVQEFGDIRASSLTEAAFLDREIKSTIDASKLNKAVMAFDAYNKVAYAAYTKKGSSHNDFVIKIDLSQGRPRISYTEKGTYVSLWNQKDSSSEDRIVSGSSNGFIRNLNSEIRQADGQTGASYTGRFKTAYTDLRDQYPQVADQNKHFDFLEFTLQPTNTNITLQIVFYVDGALRYSTSISTQSEALAFPWTFPVMFGNDEPRPIQVPLLGCYGRRISCEISNVSNSENFKISDLKYKFRPGDERIVAA